MHGKRWASVILTLTLGATFPQRADATERHVPGEYLTIQAAITAAQPGDEVVIADGVYTGAGNKNLDFGGKAITVRSAGGDPAACVIDCEGSGRGFYFHSGETASSVVQGLTIRNGNSSDGGGIYCYDSNPTLTNCTITGNTAEYFGGGGVYCEYSSATLTNCTIAGNTAEYFGGGGVYCYHSSATLTNCTITGNTATYVGYYGYGVGGGVYCEYSNPTLTNCTITGNTASQDGGGVYCNYDSPRLTNCILWADTPQEIHVYAGSPVVAYCDVHGTWSGTGNINAEPGFAFPSDFHLLPGSPCIDAGTNSPSGGLPPSDLEGNPRSIDGDGDGAALADMGVYEFDLSAPTIALSTTELVFLVRQGQTGSQTFGIRNSSLGTLAWGLEWEPDWLTADPVAGESAGEIDVVRMTTDTAGLTHGTYSTGVRVNAPAACNTPRVLTVVLHVKSTLHVPAEYPTIQAAIDAAVFPGDEVAIADGVHTGAGNKDLDFGGKAITVRSAGGDPAACVIDCEGSGRGFYFHSGETASSVVQGLTIRNGNSSDGGGIYCYNSSPTLTNCVITGNAADFQGGGVSCEGSSLGLNACAITDNSALQGGGVYVLDGSPKLIGCIIANNSCDHNGGGAFCSGAELVFQNCEIGENWALSLWDGAGAGVYTSSGSTQLTNCVLRSNTAAYAGGGAFCDGGQNTFLNCTFHQNYAVFVGGAVVSAASAQTMLRNCVCWDDSAGLGSELAVGLSSEQPELRVAYCDVESGQGAVYVEEPVTFLWGLGNFDADPLFADPANFDLQLGPGSPCVDAGDNYSVPSDEFDCDGDGDVSEPLPCDFSGRPRFVDDPETLDAGHGLAPLVDIGAYEFQTVSVHPGDLNCDGLLNAFDIDPFVLALTDGLTYRTEFPECSEAAADCNQDGAVNAFDIDPFVGLLTGG